MRFSGIIALATIALLATMASTPAQRGKTPRVCPYCGNDPDLLRSLGLVSHGPFAFGQSPKAEEGKILTTSDIQEEIPFEDFIWLDTRHFRIGSSMGRYTVTEREKLKIRAELTRLRDMGLRNISPTTRVLDEWLRLHLYAMRAEDLYSDFLRMVRKTPADFPADRSDAWKGEGQNRRFMGQGPYLGQPDKFELLITGSMRAYRTFLVNYLGRQSTQAQRWNFTVRGALLAALTEDLEGHRHDQKMHNSVAFNLSINFMDGYRFYAYNLPVWITEGVGHYFERLQSPYFNSYDTNEGVSVAPGNFWNYPPRVRMFAQTGAHTSLAQLLQYRDYSQLSFSDHLVTWSLIEFLVTQHAEPFAQLLDRMNGRINEKGETDSADLIGVQREAFREFFGWSIQGFEEAWKRHVLETYPLK